MNDNPASRKTTAGNSGPAPAERHTPVTNRTSRVPTTAGADGINEPNEQLITRLVWVVPILFWLWGLTPLVAPYSRPHLQPAWIVLMIVPPLIALAMIPLRRRLPVRVTLVMGILLFLSPGVSGAAFAIQGSHARRSHRAGPVIVLGLYFIGSSFLSQLFIPNREKWTNANTFEFSVVAVGVVLATLLGWLLRSNASNRRSALAAADARREAEHALIEQGRLLERERISREMHDVLAHRLSLVGMNAGILVLRDDLTRDETHEIAHVIQDNAKRSLEELRVMLSTLRGVDVPPEPPQPTLRELPVLIADLESIQQIDLHMDVKPECVPERIGRHTYRIVQEGLTNARKHAPGAPVKVSVSGGKQQSLEVTIDNELTNSVGDDQCDGGFGLLGLSERVKSVGGSLRYGPVNGCFVLKATLPWEKHT